MPVLRVVGGLFGLLGWIVFAGLQRVWRATFGWVFNTLAGLLDRVTIPVPFHKDVHVFGHVSAWLRSLDHNVYALLGRLALQSENLAVWLFSRLRFALSWVGREIEGLAADVLTQFLRLVYVYLPHWLARLTRQFTRGWSKLWHYARGLIPLLHRYVAALRRNFVKMLASTAHKFAAFAKLERWIAGKLYGFVKSASKRLIALERLIVPKRFRKYLAAIFPALGIAWLLSGNWIRLGKAIVQWSHDTLTAFIRYFGRWTEPQSLDALVHHAEGLVPVMIRELEFIISEFQPERLAPGPVEPPPET